MTDASSIYHKARSEVAGMLRLDLNALSGEDAIRLDVGTSLRVLMDNQSGRLLRGESLDARELLAASEALSRILPPLREPPPVDNVDPREVMWQTYLGMRKRGELFDPTSTFEGALREVERLRAELAALKAAGATAPDEPGASIGANAPVGGANAPVGSNVVRLSRPTNERTDDRSSVSPTTTERSVVSPSPAASNASAAAPPPPSAPAAPQYDYNANQDWKSYVNPDGSIRSTPRGRWDI
jgi:hypothetical protein